MFISSDLSVPRVVRVSLAVVCNMGGCCCLFINGCAVCQFRKFEAFPSTPPLKSAKVGPTRGRDVLFNWQHLRPIECRNTAYCTFLRWIWFVDHSVALGNCGFGPRPLVIKHRTMRSVAVEVDKKKNWQRKKKTRVLTVVVMTTATFFFYSSLFS